MPIPNPLLFPDPFLFPGTAGGPFAELLLDAVSPWNDPSGFWETYNAALSTMFEPVFDIVADQGDVSQTIVGILNAPLATSGPIVNLPVQAVSQTIPSDQAITLAFARSAQTFTTRAPANPGDVVIPVVSTTPNYPYPIGTPVQLEYIPGWSRLLDPVSCPDNFLPFLAQFNGTNIPIGLDAATARPKIINECAEKRGTLVAVTSAVRRNLSATKSVAILERLNPLGNADSYWFLVVVRPEEVVSFQALTDAVNAVKPGGVQWALVQTDGWTISQMELSQATITALEANFLTLTGLENDLPGT